MWTTHWLWNVKNNKNWPAKNPGMDHNRLISLQFRFHFTSQKNFRPKTSDDETIIADKTWDPKWDLKLIFSIPNDISSTAIATISVQKDYLRVTLFTTDTTILNYTTVFKDRTSNSCLKSTFIKTQETFNGTGNLTQQDIQAPSHFVKEEIVETLPTTTQQSIPIFTHHLQYHISKTKLLSREIQYNQQLSHLLFPNTRIWINKHIDQ